MIYPWSAVVGQDALKLALTLSAIDPSIGGVLVQGPRGVAKTTLARALAELVPGQFVELPLGASEERVTGSLDLGAALRDAQVNFQPGLLARAHDGVLYVDEVNLLPDALIDLLLDAAASGRNVVERDGISHTHAARFVLVGTMNPEEGELRPQLTDRFGLSVDAEGSILPPERAEIIKRRLRFDLDAEGFRAQFAREQAALKERVARARDLVPQIDLESALPTITQRCHAANVEGVRADLAMLRAARAHAALHGRTQITDEDIDAVSELALRHRRRTPPPRSSGGSSGGSSAPSSGNRSSNPGGSSSGSSFGALDAVPVQSSSAPRLPLWLTAPRTIRPETHRRGRARMRGPRGARARVAQQGTVDWFATLSRRPRTLVHRARRSPPRALWVLALDCSASMLRHGALAHAKGVARAFTAQAHRAGAEVVLISFGGDRAQVASSPRDHRSTRENTIEALPAGGNTPLAAALREAQALCQHDDRHQRIILLTDGRTREPVSAVPDVDLTVIDCERAPVRLARARTLANTLRAQYLHVDNLR